MEITIRSDATLTDQLIGTLSQIGIEGFWEDGDLLRCYISADRWSDDLREEIRRLAAMITRGSRSPAPIISFELAQGRNWNEEWEQTIRPLRVTERIVVTPSWHTFDRSGDDIVLVIDPKMSFGTGHHETTRLSLTLIEMYIRPSVRFLDVGTGTGILAIAARKLGAEFCVGLDVDEWAYRNALENVRRNNVDETVQLFLGPLSSIPAGRFDLIAANIQLDVIGTLLTEIVQRLSPDGVIVFSGLLSTEEEAFRAMLTRHRLAVRTMLAEAEWIAAAASSTQGD